MYMNKRNVIVVCADFGMGGISKSAIEWLRLVEYDKFNITLYIRRNDVLDLISFLPDTVNVITVDSQLKNGFYDNSVRDKIIKIVCAFFRKIGSKYIAKQIYRWYKYPKQRRQEGVSLRKSYSSFDVAIAYSTSDDIPTFVLEEIKADKKYLFIHQSTPISKENQKAMHSFDKTFLVSDYLYDKYQKEFPSNKTKFIPLQNYVSCENIVEMANREKVEKQKGINFATCGRLVDVKGYDILADAAIIMKEKGLNFTWSWIGDGACRRNLENLVSEKALEDYVQILGEKINPYPYMNSCDIYVQTSKAEALGLTMLEALCLGKPIVSTKTVGGNSIASKYNCAVLADISAQSVAEALYELSTDDVLRERETEKVRNIDWEKEESEYKNMWFKLLSGEM